MKFFTVNTSSPYNVYIGDNIIDFVYSYINDAIDKNKKIFVISDETVFNKYGNRLINALNGANYQCFYHAFESGESGKSLQVVGDIVQKLIDCKISRNDYIFALGGGVVGDVAGFVASIYLRGVNLVQIPTTLLSCIDSAIGGKTAVNFNGIKNMLGTFYQPKLVLIDSAVIGALPLEIYNQGLGELVKYKILLNDFSTDNLQETIYKCLKYKAKIVEKDERDLNERMLLNLGHTVGHCIERLSNFSICHGDCVAIGIAYSCKIALKLNYINKQYYIKVLDLIAGYGLPVTCEYSNEQIIQVIDNDKKRFQDKIYYVLPTLQGGKVEYMPLEVFKGLLNES